MGLTVGVAGASGYAGGELLRLISGHPHLELGIAAAGASAGQPITSVHPHLTTLADRSFVATDPAALASADLVFLALPHGESAAVAAELPDQVRVVDLGADFRLARRGRLDALLRRHATRAPGRTVSRSCPASATSSQPPPGSPTPAATPPPSPWRSRR